MTNLFRQPLHESLDSDLVDEGLGDSLSEDSLRRLDLLVKDALFELDLEGVETTRELVTEKRTSDGSLLLGQKKTKRRNGSVRGSRGRGREGETRRKRTHSTNVLRPNRLELEPSVLADLGLDVLHVCRVEGRRLVVLEDHQVEVLFIGETETGEDLQRRRGDSSL